VILTPINMEIKWTFNQFGFKVKPVKRGNQCAIPAKMPKTAPIDKT